MHNLQSQRERRLQNTLDKQNQARLSRNNSTSTSVDHPFVVIPRGHGFSKLDLFETITFLLAIRATFVKASVHQAKKENSGLKSSKTSTSVAVDTGLSNSTSTQTAQHLSITQLVTKSPESLQSTSINPCFFGAKKSHLKHNIANQHYFHADVRDHGIQSSMSTA